MIPNADWEFDVEQELTRKIIDTLEELLNQYRRGDITRHAYRTALVYLDKATRGVIDGEITQAIDLEVIRSTADERDTRVVFKANQLLLLSRVLGDDNLSTHRFVTSDEERAMRSFGDEIDGVRLCSEKQQSLVEKAVEKGFSVF